MFHHNLLLYVSIPLCLLTFHMPHPPHTPPLTCTSSHAHTSLFTHVHTWPSHAHTSPYTHITCTHLSFTHTSSHAHTSPSHLHISPLHSQIAAQSLREVTDEFLEEGNPIITMAKKMSQQMFQMAEFTHGRGELQVSTFLSFVPRLLHSGTRN